MVMVPLHIEAVITQSIPCQYQYYKVDFSAHHKYSLITPYIGNNNLGFPSSPLPLLSAIPSI